MNCSSAKPARTLRSGFRQMLAAVKELLVKCERTVPFLQCQLIPVISFQSQANLFQNCSSKYWVVQTVGCQLGFPSRQHPNAKVLFFFWPHSIAVLSNVYLCLNVVLVRLGGSSVKTGRKKEGEGMGTCDVMHKTDWYIVSPYPGGVESKTSTYCQCVLHLIQPREVSLVCH